MAVITAFAVLSAPTPMSPVASAQVEQCQGTQAMPAAPGTPDPLLNIIGGSGLQNTYNFIVNSLPRRYENCAVTSVTFQITITITNPVWHRDFSLLANINSLTAATYAPTQSDSVRWPAGISCSAGVCSGSGTVTISEPRWNNITAFELSAYTVNMGVTANLPSNRATSNQSLTLSNPTLFVVLAPPPTPTPTPVPPTATPTPTPTPTVTPTPTPTPTPVLLVETWSTRASLDVGKTQSPPDNYYVRVPAMGGLDLISLPAYDGATSNVGLRGSSGFNGAIVCNSVWASFTPATSRDLFIDILTGVGVEYSPTFAFHPDHLRYSTTPRLGIPTISTPVSVTLKNFRIIDRGNERISSLVPDTTDVLVWGASNTAVAIQNDTGVLHWKGATRNPIPLDGSGDIVVTWNGTHLYANDVLSPSSRTLPDKSQVAPVIGMPAPTNNRGNAIFTFDAIEFDALGNGKAVYDLTRAFGTNEVGVSCSGDNPIAYPIIASTPSDGVSHAIAVSGSLYLYARTTDITQTNLYSTLTNPDDVGSARFDLVVDPNTIPPVGESDDLFVNNGWSGLLTVFGGVDVLPVTGDSVPPLFLAGVLAIIAAVIVGGAAYGTFHSVGIGAIGAFLGVIAVTFQSPLPNILIVMTILAGIAVFGLFRYLWRPSA